MNFWFPCTITSSVFPPTQVIVKVSDSLAGNVKMSFADREHITTIEIERGIVNELAAAMLTVTKDKKLVGAGEAALAVQRSIDDTTTKEEKKDG